MPEGSNVYIDAAPDWTEADPFFGALIRAAAWSDGDLLVCTFGEDPATGAPLPRNLNLHVPTLGPLDSEPRILTALREAVGRLAAIPGANVYAGVALTQPGLTEYQRGKEEQVVGMLGFCGDADAAHDPATYAERLPLPPHMVVETSPGNRQAWILFDRPYPVAEARPVVTALTRCMGGDSTQSGEHVFRVPGCLNWPTKKKLAAGRSPIPFRARLLTAPDPQRPGVSLETLRAAVLKNWPDAFERASADSDEAAEFDWHTATKSDCRPFAENTIFKKLGSPGEVKTKRPGDRSAVVFAVARECRKRGYTPEQVYELFHAYDRLWAFEHYHEHPSGFEASLRADIRRAFTKKIAPTAQPIADVFRAYLGEDRQRPARRVIRLGGSYLSYAVDAAEVALIEQGSGYYQRGDFIVRMGAASVKTHAGQTIDVARLFTVGVSEIREQMTKAARFEVYQKTEDEWQETNCPKDVAETYVGLKGRWNLPHLTGVIDAPTLRPDGSLIEQAGYDEATGLFYVPGTVFPSIPASPTRQDALAALARLKELVSTFDFVTPADHSVWLSNVLTKVIRRSLAHAPLFLFKGPVFGSGKSMLSDVATVIATGNVGGVTNLTQDEAETEKRLVSELLTGAPVILIDNVTFPLKSAFLSSMLTQPIVKPRLLGGNQKPSIVAGVTVDATGNNITVEADRSRRAVRCSIDPKHEAPETRKFDNNPIADAKRDRARLLVDALTILIAYRLAGSPPQSGEAFGNFEHWSRTVRDALLWLGEADPCDTRAGLKADDPDKEQLGGFLHLWADVIGTARVSAKRAVEIAAAPAEGDRAVCGVRLVEAFQDVAPPAAGGRGINTKRLGAYIASIADRPVNGRRIVRDGTLAGYTQWRLEILRRDGEP